MSKESAIIEAGAIETGMQDNQSSLVLISESASQTYRIGKVLGDGLIRGMCVALTGELGAGKTCMTQGIACGLGVPDCYTVTSPTFTLINEYPGCKAALIHMDVYRLSGSSELEDMGYEEYLDGGGVMVIEWAEKIRDALPAETLYVTLTYLEENKRKIEISGERDRMIILKQTLTGGGC